MRVIDLEEVASRDEACALSIGFFDGVHLGHRAVLRLLRNLADARGLQSTVVTFDHHPATVIRPEHAPALLTTFEHKLELIERTQLVDTVAVIRFDEERAKEPAASFVERTLVDALHARLVIVGADFHFGAGRQGNVALLDTMGANLGFEVIGLGLVAPGDDPAHSRYSSTRIRKYIAEGEVDQAAAELGRPHEVRGAVEHGDARGRTLGFPTANIAVHISLALPADGIYAAWVIRADGSRVPAAVSLGRRPTFYDEHGQRLLEAHLLDQDVDLYGEVLGVRFVQRLRDQIAFSNTEDLVAQIASDAAAARTLLASPLAPHLVGDEVPVLP